MRKMIGLGCEKDGLYLLDSQLPVVSSAIKKDVSSRLDELLVWHRHLGHLSFSALKKMFPHLLVSHCNFLCEFCQLAKYCKSVYPISNKNKCSLPFQLMHSDV